MLVGGPSQPALTRVASLGAGRPVRSQMRKVKSFADLAKAAPSHLGWDKSGTLKGEERTEPVTEGPLAEMASRAAGNRRLAAKVRL